MMQLIHLYQEANWTITFATTAQPTPWSNDLKGLHVKTRTIVLNDTSFDQFVQALNPDVVLFDRFMVEEQFGWRVAQSCPKALRILNTEDLHSLRKVRQNAYKQNIPFDISHLRADPVTLREVASIFRSDYSLMISKVEIELLQDYFQVPSFLLHYLPLLLDHIDNETYDRWNTFDQRTNFVTIGNFRHDPNWDSILYLKQTIWPLIRKALPKAELHVYGSYLPQKAQALHNIKEGFLIKGRAEDVAVIMRKARVCLAPLRFGAGIKGKFIDAMLQGTPSVTTAIGSEGIANSSEWSGIIANEPAEISKGAIDLYTNSDQWNRASANGAKIINKYFDKGLFTPNFIEQVSKLLEVLPHHRSQNFIGAMLQHHTTKSTYYMSKWIEEKNQNIKLKKT